VEGGELRVLVTGASGGLGRYVLRELKMNGYEVFAPSSSEMPVQNRLYVLNTIEHAQPQAILHLAALANVDRCSTEPELAMAVNALGTMHVAEAAVFKRIRLVYASTNDVFSECVGGPFSEDRVPVPGMPYSSTKLTGELAVRAVGGYAIRANFFTRHCNAKKSFVDYVLTSAKKEDPFPCYTNVLSTPVHASTLAKRLVDALMTPETGVLHLCSYNFMTRAEQAEAILRAYGLPTDRISPVPLLERRGRPLDARLTSIFGGVVGSIADEIKKLVTLEPL
jgi:dTDP-4-dehydrorhamnose reductase